MDSAGMRRQIVIVRAVLGVSTIVAPRPLGRLFGVDPADNPVSPYLLRLFGIRELYMAWELHSAEDDDVEGIVSRGIPVDAADGVASALGGVAGYFPRRAAIMSTATAAFGTFNGLMLRAKLREERAAESRINQ